MVGLTRVELVTSSLSGTRSNQLSYKPGGFFGREAEHFVVVYVGFNLAPEKDLGAPLAPLSLARLRLARPLWAFSLERR